jgi:Zn-dependent protease
MIEDGSLKIGSFFGIPLKVHWTFGLIVIYVMLNVINNNSFWFLWYIALLFISVVLHEYGHALTAKRFSINTKDIILSPIGGVARLENLPDKPWHEMLVAIAGPFVNLVIVLLISIILFATGEQSIVPENLERVDNSNVPEFFKWVIVMNLALFIFNLIPAFPMDGGRILRAGLAIKLGKTKATRIASLVGRILAIAFVVFGFIGEQYTLLLIGIVIFFMATREMRDTLLTEKLSKLYVKDFMRNQFTLLHISEFMEKPIELYKRNGESNFLVTNGLNEIVGTLPSVSIKDAIKENAHNDRIEEWISKVIATVNPEDTLLHTFEKLNKVGAGILLVTKDEKMEAVIDREAVMRGMNL